MKGAIFDTETAKMKLEHMVYDRKIYSSYLPSSAIVRPRWMPCASWKIIGKDRIHSACVLDDPKRFKKDYSDDYVVVKALWELMHEVDFIVAHNCDNFDWKIITTRFLYHGLGPCPRVKTVDTLKIARSQFRLEANDLRYLAWYLKLDDQKDEAPDWDRISMGDPEEIKKCLKYNRKDVKVLEPIYYRLLPFSKIRLYSGDEECQVCGSKKYQARGPAKIGPHRWEYQCLAEGCRKWWTGKPPVSRKDLVVKENRQSPL